MLDMREKTLVHFDTNHICVYDLKDNSLNLLERKCVNLNTYSDFEQLLSYIDIFLGDLEKSIGELSNERTRIYATGLFQSLTPEEKNRLIINVFVNYGIYFYIVPADLEQFYQEKSLAYGGNDIVEGLVHQEFRKVVICGSFQQHLKEIGSVMDLLQERDVTVLSPWTTKIVPETLGTDFILLEGQTPLKNERDAWRHKYEHMDKFRQSDAVIVCNPDGEVGKGTMFEFGFLVAISKRIIFTERPKDLSLPFPFEVGLNF